MVCPQGHNNKRVCVSVRFKSGMLGACIVVLALLGGVIFGFMGNVSTEPTTERGYRTIADATGLFNASNDRIYTDFTPAKNYTGWSTGSVTFNGTNTANPYYIVTDPGELHTVTINLQDYNTGHDVATGTYQAPYIWGGYNYTLADLLSDQGVDLGSSATVHIDVESSNYNTYTYTVGGSTLYRFIPTNWVQVNPSNIGVPSDSLTWVSALGNTYSYYDGYTSIHRTDAYLSGLVTTISPVNSTNTPHISTGGVASFVGESSFTSVYNPTDIWLEVNPTNGVVICYSQTNNIVKTEFTSTINDCSLAWPGADGEHIAYYGANRTDNPFEIQKSAGALNPSGAGNYNIDSPFPYTTTVTLTYTTNAVGSYVKIAEGFDLTGASTTWANGYENGALDLVMAHATGLSSNYTYTIYDPDNNALGSITVTNQDTQISFNGGASVSYGAWDSYIIRAVARDGLYFIPLLAFDNFQSYTPGEPVKIGDLTGGDVASFDLSGTTPRFSVENTLVWMDQYGVIMNGPSIDPRALFPSDAYPVLTLSLKNFTVFGSSITINGTPYPMTGDVITVGDDSQPLGKITIKWEENNHTYMDLGNGDIDLGETVNTTVSLAGAWYFTATVNEGYNYDSQVLNWAVGQWGLNETQFIIVYEGLILAGIVVCKRARGVTFTALDWIVTVFAGLGGLMIV